MPAYADALNALSARLSERALAHSERVAETAAWMAEAYGVDVEEARLAALLHDWAKDESNERLLSEARRLGVPLTHADESTPELLHARVGAAQVAEALHGLPPHVVTAIAHHTLGAAEMTDLDRIVYVADSIEPARHYPGVDELREAVGKAPLTELFARSIASSIAYVVATGRKLHPVTVEVWNAVVAREAGR